jgi:hypothetical protein
MLLSELLPTYPCREVHAPNHRLGTCLDFWTSGLKYNVPIGEILGEPHYLCTLIGQNENLLLNRAGNLRLFLK